jgi:hypothetical protein
VPIIIQEQSLIVPSEKVDETKDWKTYIDSKNRFSFKYPPIWILEDNKPNPSEITLTYTENNKNFYLTIRTGGTGGPEADKIENQETVFAGKKFIKRIWIKAELPFFVSFMPNEAGFDLFNHIEMTLPAENNNKYLQIFDQILSTFKFWEETGSRLNIYKNDEFKFAFDLTGEERALVCPNKNEYNDNIAVEIRPKLNEPLPTDVNECAKGGQIDKTIFASKKAESLNSIEDYLKQLQSPGNDYKIITSSITVSGISGFRVIGNRNQGQPAPLPEKIDLAVFYNKGILYVLDALYLNKNFRIVD